MSRFLNLSLPISLIAGAALAMAQTPAAQPTPPAAAPAPPVPPRPTASQLPVRDPHAPGFVTATKLPDGAVPPPTADGNFIIGPTHKPAPETIAQPDVPKGTVFEFAMSSADSKIYPGIAREPGTFGTADPSDPTKMVVTTSHPLPTPATSPSTSPVSTSPEPPRRSWWCRMAEATGRGWFRYLTT